MLPRLVRTMPRPAALLVAVFGLGLALALPEPGKKFGKSGEKAFHDGFGDPINPDEMEEARMEALRDGGGGVELPPNGTADPILNVGVKDQMEGMMLEGDIQMSPGLMQRNAIRNEWQKWPDGRIPYVIDWTFDEAERRLIAHAFDVYHSRTCLQFVPRAMGQTNYLHLMKGTGCSSMVGMVGRGRQDVSLGRGCVYLGIILHELMHAAGFMHEQSRADRDQYVTIDFNNIDPANHYNFRKHGTNEINHLGTKYDCNSVMHYNAYAFALDPRRPTIYLKDPYSKCKLGQREMFSQNDIDKINMLYGCGGDKNTKPDVDRPDLEMKKCKDGHKRCEEWAGKRQCSANPDWMLPNCPVSCGSCNKLCLDYHPRCKEWSRRGECAANAAYMTSYCRGSCLCGNSRDAEATCADALHADKCGYWQKKGHCKDENKSFKKYMEINCRKTCQLCKPLSDDTP